MSGEDGLADFGLVGINDDHCVHAIARDVELAACVIGTKVARRNSDGQTNDGLTRRRDRRW